MGNTSSRAVGIRHGTRRRCGGFGDGHRIIDRRAVTLTQVIEDIDIVDIVDMDIQMAEADVIDASLSTLAKIVRLHIGTHSPAIEDRLDQTLSRAGWLNERRFTWETLQSTPYGEVP
ncbi:MAG: hypothetical protein FJX19_11245, partial [Alphaproteobacteria bacterium]|nr:hypothetical protein [Alphaproteobacteria bacterium]